MLPRDSRAAVKRRADYRPPAFLVDRSTLEFDLDPESTWVTSTARVPPQSRAAAVDERSGAAGPRRRAAGRTSSVDARRLRSITRACSTPGALTVLDPPGVGNARRPLAHRAGEQRRPSKGCTSRPACSARRTSRKDSAASRIFPDRPDVLATYTVTIRADRAACPVLLSNGNLVETGALARRPALREVARSVSQALVPVRARRRRPRVARRHVHDDERARSVALSIYSTPRNLPRCKHAMAALKASMHWDERAFRPRVRPRPLHDLLRRRLQHGRDGEQGPQHLQQPAGPRRPGDGDRRRLPGDRGRRRPRVLPQLDRQSRDLPRLVPAVAQGRADGLPRPGIHQRHGFARGGAHRGRRVPAARPVRRGRGPDGASGAAGRVSGDQQLLHGDRVREGRRGHPHAAHAARAGARSAAAWTCTSSGTTGRP